MFISRLSGHIYNYKKSEIIDLYKDNGYKFGNLLDGDFHLEIEDENKTIVVSDFAGSKSDGLVPPNSTVVIESNKIIHKHCNFTTTDFNYDQFEKIDSYELFFEAVNNAVVKRIPKQIPIVPLSGGHDSGTVCAALLNTKTVFEVVSITGNEPIDCMESRWEMLKDNNIEVTKLEGDGPISLQRFDELKEEFKLCDIDTNYKNVSSHYMLSKNIPNRTIISGLGADELYVSGDWELLETFMKASERVYNYFNIDARYPLLDRSVYKEFKRLKGPLTRRHKQPFEKYMTKTNFPVNMGKKVGFYVFENY